MLVLGLVAVIVVVAVAGVVVSVAVGLGGHSIGIVGDIAGFVKVGKYIIRFVVE